MENGKTYRIKANPGEDTNLYLDLTQNYETFEILSLKIDPEKDFRLHSSKYGIVVGRVIANGGIGVPNAKISVFIRLDNDDVDNEAIKELYPFVEFSNRDKNGLRYNVLPKDKVNKSHQAVGSMPAKEYILDNNDILEVFDKYYKLTTRTNDSGDFMLSGVPVGTCTVHMDLDLSDCGLLSQRPRDFLYKGHSIEEFESPNLFKKSKDLEYLSQIISENNIIDVIPFWGNESVSPKVGITRCDINVTYKFEPTCVFMGSLVGDDRNAGISKKCVPSANMGEMENLISGRGTVEIIRKTLTGAVEELQIKGTELIDSDGVWCFQIPMNLDYVKTDEYGNLVPTDNPEKGLPTRARVRFRISMSDGSSSNDLYFRTKMLIPNNPQGANDIDYAFGSYTKDDSFRDLFWDNVYTVKSYFPRFQKGTSIKSGKFSGIKRCNNPGNNNPMPYNNLRIKMPFGFSLACSLIKTYIGFVSVWNKFVKAYGTIVFALTAKKKTAAEKFKSRGIQYATIKGGFCPDLDNWYFAPRKTHRKDASDIIGKEGDSKKSVNLLAVTLENLIEDDFSDSQSIDSEQQDPEESYCITRDTDYLLSCVEMNLAQEYKVINFDFYNDWINGVLYFPRWQRVLRKKKSIFFNLITVPEKERGCIADPRIFGWSRKYVQQCALSYKENNEVGKGVYNKIGTPSGCRTYGKRQVCHGRNGLKAYSIFKKQGGIVKPEKNLLGQYVYYLKPCEFSQKGVKVNLFATDLVLLGSLKEDNLYGIPQTFTYLAPTSFQMPPNLAQTNLDEDGPIYFKGGSTGSYCTESKENLSLAYSSVAASDSTTGFGDLNQISNGEYTYEGEDDPIPVTEVSGISWGYSGYGQGKNNFKTLYFPGGHFLGLTCSTSQTNIKSCVNLQRVCELGTGLSARHEMIGGYNADEKALQHYYLVPNGLISNDDLIDNDFRTIFSTLNSKPLIYEERGGRAVQVFNYLNTKGFSGDLKKNVGNESYNKKVQVTDYLTSLNLEKAISYDSEEANRTFTRSSENASLDYYLYRFGVDKATDSRNKFLVGDSYVRGLPQYENSFYFYFGLHPGATALDKLNHDFFSVSEEPEKPKPNIVYEIRIDNNNYCKMSGDLVISTLYAEPPLNIVLTTVGYNEVKTIEEQSDSANITIPNVKFGKYQLSITDRSGRNKKGIIEVGINLYNTNLDIVPFKIIPGPSKQAEDIVQMPKEGDPYSSRKEIGGFIKIKSTITIDGEEINLGNLDNTNYCIFILSANDANKRYYTCSRKDISNGPTGIDITNIDRVSWKMLPSDESGYYNINLWDPNARYDVYLGVKCSNEHIYTYCLLDSLSLLTKDFFKVYHGCKLLPYNGGLDHLSIDWHKSLIQDTSGSRDSGYFIDGLTNDPEIKKERHKMAWALRHFCINRSSDILDSQDSGIIVESLGSETPMTISSGNPEKFVSGKDAKIIPFITGYNSESFEFTNFTDIDLSLFRGYDLSSSSLTLSTGQYFIGTNSEYMHTVKTRPLNGFFAYSQRLLTFTPILTNQVTITLNEEGKVVIIAKIPIDKATLLTDSKNGVGLKAFLQIGDDKFSIISMCESKLSGNEYIVTFRPDNESEFKGYQAGRLFEDVSKVIKPFYYYPFFQRPMRVTGNLLSTVYIKAEPAEEGGQDEYDYDFQSYPMGYIFIENDNYVICEDGITIDDVINKKEINGRPLVFIEQKFSRLPNKIIEGKTPDEKTFFYSESGEMMFDKYFTENTQNIPDNIPYNGFGDSVIITSQEVAPADYKSFELDSSHSINLASCQYNCNSVFYSYIKIDKDKNTIEPMGDTDDVEYYFVHKDSGIFPLGTFNLYSKGELSQYIPKTSSTISDDTFQSMENVDIRGEIEKALNIQCFKIDDFNKLPLNDLTDYFIAGINKKIPDDFNDVTVYRLYALENVIKQN